MHFILCHVYYSHTYISKTEVLCRNHEARLKFLHGTDTTGMTDEEILALPRSGYMVRFNKTASRFRKELIERYGAEKGAKVRTAEAFMVCEYGAPLTEEKKKELFPF